MPNCEQSLQRLAKLLLRLAIVLSAGHLFAVEKAPNPLASAQKAHEFLLGLCDTFGGRLAGSETSHAAQRWMAGQLKELGLAPEFNRFSFPGWERGNDSVEMITPLKRGLRVAALSYTQPCGPFETEIIGIGSGRIEDFPKGTEGKVGLVDSGSPAVIRELLQRSHARGLRALLLINRERGGQLLARTGSFIGESLPIPVFSMTQEDGLWVQRLLRQGQTVRIRIETRSRCRDAEGANLIVRLPGNSPERIIVAAHFDSWDLGQGAIDNGLGVAQLYAIAHAWRGRTLQKTVELIWFDAEELGLWGSRHQASSLGNAPVAVMVNLDMAGVPVGVNAMGDESLIPALERWQAGRVTRLDKGIMNNGWFGGDHIPYQLAGVRALTFHGPIEPALVRYYHDFADTADKVPLALLTESTAVITDVLWALVQDPLFKAWRRTDENTKRLFSESGFDQRMQSAGWLSGLPRDLGTVTRPSSNLPQNPNKP